MVFVVVAAKLGVVGVGVIAGTGDGASNVITGVTVLVTLILCTLRGICRGV